MNFCEYCFENDDFIGGFAGVNVKTFAFYVAHYKG
jgi:hypothetical protein